MTIRSHLRRRLLTLGLSLAVALSALMVLPEPALALGSIAGTVIGDGSPLDGVVVEAVPAGGGDVAGTATTTDTGTYSLDLDAGTYDVVATPPAGSPYGPTTVTGIAVGDGAIATVDIVLSLVDPGSDLEGSFVADGTPLDGTPLAGATIEADGSSTTTGTDGGWSLAVTNPTGIIELDWSGDCTALPALPESIAVRTGYDADQATTYPVTPTFVPLEITVVESDGVTPVEGASVSTFSSFVFQAGLAPLGGSVDAGTSFGCGVTTGADGTATLPASPGGETTVFVREAGSTQFSDASADADVGASGGTITVTLPAAPVTVSGRVLGWDGTPADGVRVTPDGPEGPTVTDADGRFSLDLVPGDRTLSFSRFDNDQAPTVGAFDFDVTIPDGDPVDLGTWRVPAVEYDVSVVKDDTDEVVDVDVFYAADNAVKVDGFGTVTSVGYGGTTYGGFGPLLLLEGATHTITVPSSQVPDGYEQTSIVVTVPDSPPGTTVPVELRLLQSDPEPEPTPLSGTVQYPDETFPIGERVFWSAAGAQGQATIADDGTFQVLVPPGDVALVVSLTDVAGYPAITTYAVDVVVPTEGLDLGLLTIPDGAFIDVDLRVAVPAEDEPVAVDVATKTVAADDPLDSAWGPLTVQATVDLAGTADGTSIPLRTVATAGPIELTITPDETSPYLPIVVERAVGDGDIIQVQLQRESDPVDLPPEISTLPSISKGESAPNTRLSAAASDPEGGAVTIGWEVLGVDTGGGPVNLTETGGTIDLGPLDGPQSFDAVVTACDPAGNCASQTVPVQIRDELPTLGVSVPSTVDEGEVVTLTADASDPRDPVAVDVDWGDGTTDADIGGSATHSYAAPGVFTVTVSAVTKDGTTTVTRVIEAVAVDVPPTIDAGPDATIDEGTVLTRTAVASDPDGDPLTVGWDLDGDGVVDVDGATIDLAAGDGPATRTLSAIACAAGTCVSDPVSVSVVDVLPTVTVDGPAEGTAGEPITLTIAAIDPADPVGVDVDWGDGTVESYVGGSASHTYATSGNFTITVSAATKDGTTVETVEVSVQEAEAAAEPVSVFGVGWAHTDAGFVKLGLRVRAGDDGEVRGGVLVLVPGRHPLLVRARATSSLRVDGRVVVLAADGWGRQVEVVLEGREVGVTVTSQSGVSLFGGEGRFRGLLAVR